MWQMHPSWDSHQIAHTGDQIYNSQETFQAYEGNSSVKLWGLYNGGENENNLYREFSNSQLPVGTEIQLNAQFFTHADDNMLNWGNNTVLFIKYFAKLLSTIEYKIIEFEFFSASDKIFNIWFSVLVNEN